MDFRKVSERNRLVEMYAGSIAYGTNLPTSDIDVRGIFVADPISIRTPFFEVGEVDIPGGDTKFYELNKFMKLLIDQNPNIIELAWTSGQDIIASSPGYELIRQARGTLLTSKIAATTTGYAHSQLNRLKNSKRHVTNLKPLKELCDILVTALNDGMITNDFIESHCGPDVIKFMKEQLLIP